MFHTNRQERVAYSFVQLAEADSQMLTAEERAHSEAYSSQVRREAFVAGRHAASLSMAELSVERESVLVGESKQPIFPANLVGSIAHCHEFAVCVLSSSSDYLSLGVDVEDVSRDVSRGLRSRICVGSEQAWVEEAAGEENKRLLMLFSAKESIYKALFPLCKHFFGFSAVELIWDGVDSFSGALREELSTELGIGFFVRVSLTFEGKHVLALCVIDHQT